MSTTTPPFPDDDNSLEYILVSFFVVVIGVLYLIHFLVKSYLTHYFNSKQPFDGIPSPPDAHWLFGHLSVMSLSNVTEHMHLLARKYANENGQTGMWSATGRRIIVLMDVEDARQTLACTSHRSSFSLTRLHMERFLGKRSIGMLNGKEWKCLRSVSIRGLTGKVVRDHMTSAIRDVMGAVHKAFRDKKPLPLTNYNVVPLMKMITMDVFARVALSKDLGCCQNLEPSPISSAFDFLQWEFYRRLFLHIAYPSSHLYWLFTADNRRHARESHLLRTFLANVVQEEQTRKQSAAPETRNNNNSSLLSQLIDAYQEQEKKAASDEIVSDILMTLLFAGYDTLSVTLTYALYHVAAFPEVEKHMLDEIRRCDAMNGLTDANDLAYCRSVVYEALRLYPPGVIATRSLDKELTLKGKLVVPGGVLAIISIWEIHRDEKYFPQPNDFRPDRWVRKDGNVWQERDEGKDDGGTIPPANRKAFLAFSSGTRVCVGYHFAMQEAVLVLAHLIKSLKFTLTEGYVLEPFREGLIQSPKGGLPMTIEWREG